MTFYRMHPEVAGGLGERTQLDRSVHPPIVHQLHYEFDGWLGDELLESFPSFIVTDALAQQLVASGLTGFSLAPVEVSYSEQFGDVQPPPSRPAEMPSWQWLQIHGTAAVDDLGLTQLAELVVSMRARSVLTAYASTALFEPFVGAP